MPPIASPPVLEAGGPFHRRQRRSSRVGGHVRATQVASHHIERREVERCAGTADGRWVRGPVLPDEPLVVDGVHTAVSGEPLASTLKKSALSMTTHRIDCHASRCPIGTALLSRSPIANAFFVVDPGIRPEFFSRSATHGRSHPNAARGDVDHAPAWRRR